MEETDSAEPSSSQLTNVLSKSVTGDTPQQPGGQDYLETEIDTYTGVDLKNQKNSRSAEIPERPSTPPKPPHRAFTFVKTNPFNEETNSSSLPRYAEVKKPKNRPKVPPKPPTHSKVTASTLTHAAKIPEEMKISKEDYFFRVNSLPSLAPEINHPSIRASKDFSFLDSVIPPAPGYGQINRAKQTSESDVSEYHNAEEIDDVLPESPPYVDLVPPENDSSYDDTYEDVKQSALGDKILKKSWEMREGSDSDYTIMSSPMSEINFKFNEYENCAMIQTPDDVFHPPMYENFPPTKLLSDPNVVALPDCGLSALPNEDTTSPTSSYDDQDSSVYSVQSSMPSTTTSSFQRVQVCFFPPSPPPDVPKERPASAISGSSTRSRSTRSRIPVPIKSTRTDHAKTPTAEVRDQLPPTPTPSPVVNSKNRSKHAKPIELSPPTTPGNELTPNGKPLGSSAKGSRWYEKLGCIQSDTVDSSEPYGRPGERKRSKSQIRQEQRKSQFFLPVEPATCNLPNPTNAQ